MSARYPILRDLATRPYDTGRECREVLAEIDKLRDEVRTLRRLSADDTAAHELDRLAMKDEIAKLATALAATYPQGEIVRLMQVIIDRDAEIDGWRGMAEDLWDELMAWHYDDCPFPDTPIGTTDDACSCHTDIKAKWDEVTR